MDNRACKNCMYWQKVDGNSGLCTIRNYYTFAADEYSCENHKWRRETTFTTDRLDVSIENVQKSIEAVWCGLTYRLNQKGRGTLKSSHEIYGILAEELEELLDAIRSHDDKRIDSIKKELEDIAVGAVFGIACIINKTIDW